MHKPKGTLRDRKIVQWAIAYLASAWVVLQVASLLATTYEWPQAVMRGLPALLITGFVIVMIIAWYHGERGRQRVSAAELALLVATLVIGGAAVWRTSQSDGDSAGAKSIAAAAPTEINPQSVAVLPFTTPGADASNVAFAEGLTDELINALSRISGVPVAARTSSFAARARSDDVRAIGSSLRVAHVVEGTLRRADRRLRINVQLVNVQSGLSVWSQTYDREVVDVFSIQEEIARSVAEALRGRLSGSDSSRLARRPTESFRAYELYLLGRSLWNQRTPVSLKKAIVNFKAATELDPAFAEAYAGLADAYNLQGVFGLERGTIAFREGERNALKAMQLDSLLSQAHSSLAFARLHLWRFQGVEAGYQRAIRLDPKSAVAHQWYAGYLALTERWQESAREMQRARELEPLSLGIITDQARDAYLQRRYGEAEAHLRQALEVDSTFARTHGTLGMVYVMQSRYDDAIREFKVATTLAGGWYPNRWGDAGLARAYAMKGDTTNARRILRMLENSAAYVSPEALAPIYSALGDQQAALHAMSAALRDHAININWLVHDPALQKLRDLQGFKPIAQRLPRR